ncbi:MAG: diguanylate cyclase [Thiotrichales bacterium]|nr:MAG: diguanylate cyclase [Thiotrichales bacterium]
MKMPVISPAVRISFGLVMFTISVLLIADLLGMLPKKEMMLLEARKRICESLAVQMSIAASSSNDHILEETLKSFVDRNDDVSAAMMRKEGGEVVIEHGEFENVEYMHIVDQRSTDNFIVIPIFDRSERWGSVNVEFADYKAGVIDWLSGSIFGLLLFVALSTFVGFIIILRKTLRVLDPKAVVPDRVKSAFNALAEGVLILDDKEQIMMANDAFAKQIDKEPEKLVGAKASALKWKMMKSDEHAEELPWVSSLEGGIRKIGVALNLSTPHMGIRSMSTNSAPILDDAGKTRGALVTFDDITDVEESNILLENAVTTLQRNDAEIRRKNQELEVLASRDALTGCFNRRAFFDLLEEMFKQSARTNTDLACIMLDIDHFKSINDRFGHSVGDEAIRMVSEILNGCEFDDAIVGRYGGEEFCVALPNTGLGRAKDLAESFREQIRKTSADFCDKEVSITASFGVANTEADMAGISELLEHADRALYAAKESGRNRVVTWLEQDDLTPREDRKSAGSSFQDRLHAIDTDDCGYSEDVRLLSQRIKQLESEIRDKESEYLKCRFTDPITDLPTRIIFEDRVSQAMAYSSRAENILAIAIFNIDMFSRINNTLGQVVGDEFLKVVGQRLKTILRRSDTVASMVAPGQSGPSLSRLHDDEFALLLTGIESIESLTYIIKRIQEKFSGKIDVAENELFVTTTIGLSLYPADGVSAKALIENARSAQKHAKSMVGKNNYQFFSQEINQRIIEQMKLEIDMHNAIEKNQFRLIYQPKFDGKTEKIVSLEALVRWDHPEKGLIAPNQFIPAAEKTGLVVDIGKWSLDTACKQAREWVGLGANDLRVSVNISAVEFANDKFVDMIKQVLQQNKLEARHLELEVTETTVMTDLDKSVKIIEELRFMGVTVTLDDFGTGYSSFNYLGRLNLDWIKIDRSFLLDAIKHKRTKTLYSGMVSMGREIGLKVVAEGIESQDEYNFVRKLRVDEMQGYMLSKPLDANNVTSALFAGKNKRRKAG